MLWRSEGALDFLSLDGHYIGVVGPSDDHFAAWAVGETQKTARARDTARAYLEGVAAEVVRGICFADHAENGPEFEPDTYSLNRKDDAKNKKSAALLRLEF